MEKVIFLYRIQNLIVVKTFAMDIFIWEFGRKVMVVWKRL